MIFLIAPLLIALAVFLETLFVKWFCWALYDVGYVDHALDWGQSFTVALPLVVFSAGLGALGRNS